VASILVQPDDIQGLISRIVLMRNNLSEVVMSLRASRLDLETTWQGGSTPTHVEAEMNRIEKSITENTEALDRLAEALKQIKAAYESADEQISRAFDV
jgi:WXG100 family type VII secretion target